MTTFLLIRHATTAATGKRLGGRTEARLDARGREQAAELGQRLAELRLRAVYASPLPRTRETAAEVAAHHGLEVGESPGLLEMEYGQWTDRPLASLARTKRWQAVQQRPSRVTFPDGESLRAAQIRAVDALEELAGRHRRGLVAAVTHADVIKLVTAFVIGQPLDLFQRIEVAPASVTVLELPAEGPARLVRLNDDGPLPVRLAAPSGGRRDGRASRRGARSAARRGDHHG